MTKRKDELGATMRGDNIKPKDLPNIVKSLRTQIRFMSRLAMDKDGLIEKNRGKKYVDKMKVDTGKFLHRINVNMTLAMLFGYGDQSGAVDVVDTSKLPTIKELKKNKPSKAEMKKMLKKAKVKKPMFELK